MNALLEELLNNPAALATVIVLGLLFLAGLLRSLLRLAMMALLGIILYGAYLALWDHSAPDNLDAKARETLDQAGKTIGAKLDSVDTGKLKQSAERMVEDLKGVLPEK